MAPRALRRRVLARRRTHQRGKWLNILMQVRSEHICTSKGWFRLKRIISQLKPAKQHLLLLLSSQSDLRPRATTADRIAEDSLCRTQLFHFVAGKKKKSRLVRRARALYSFSPSVVLSLHTSAWITAFLLSSSHPNVARLLGQLARTVCAAADDDDDETTTKQAYARWKIHAFGPFTRSAGKKETQAGWIWTDSQESSRSIEIMRMKRWDYCRYVSREWRKSQIGRRQTKTKFYFNRLMTWDLTVTWKKNGDVSSSFTLSSRANSPGVDFHYKCIFNIKYYLQLRGKAQIAHFWYHTGAKMNL